MSADLHSSSVTEATLNFLALGGSGARALEPLLHMCALGLGPGRLRVILIDPDQSNAGVTRARETIDAYRRAREALAARGAADSFFRTEVLDPVREQTVWSPIQDEQFMPSARFDARVDRNSMTGSAAPLGRLFDTLFARRIRDMDLDMGFRGVPSIGTVFMHRLRDERFFEQLLTYAHSEGDSRYFAVGSVFGGTGASALPVVGRSLVEGIQPEGRAADIEGVDRSRVGAAIFLPYFTLPSADATHAPDGGVRPEAALFAQNAAAALPMYMHDPVGYSSIYVLGDAQPREQERNAVGGAAQDNRPHYVEFFAALAALDFMGRGGEPESGDRPAFHVTAVKGTNVTWDDLPLDAASLRSLMGGVTAVYTFLRAFQNGGRIRHDLDSALKGVTWLDPIDLRSGAVKEHGEAMQRTADYFHRVWDWLAALRASTPSAQFIRSANVERTPVGEALEFRQSPPEKRRLDDVHDAFRYWNEESHRMRDRRGLPGLMEVMRRGSELLAEKHFGAPEPGGAR